MVSAELLSGYVEVWLTRCKWMGDAWKIINTSDNILRVIKYSPQSTNRVVDVLRSDGEFLQRNIIMGKACIVTVLHTSDMPSEYEQGFHVLYTDGRSLDSNPLGTEYLQAHHHASQACSNTCTHACMHTIQESHTYTQKQKYIGGWEKVSR